MQLITETNLSPEEQMAAICARYGISRKNLAHKLGYQKATLNMWRKKKKYPSHLQTTLRGLEQELINSDVDK